MKQGITFADVTIIPTKSEVFSRKDVSTKTRLSRHIEIGIPLVSANMDTVTEDKMAIALALNGGIGVIHRFLSIEEQARMVRRVKRFQNYVIEDPMTVSSQATVMEMKEKMAQEDISSVLVVENTGSKKEKVLGIVTARDLLFEEDSNKKAMHVMTKKLITALPNISVAEARRIFHKRKIEKLPLVDKEGVLRGLLTSRDILNREQFPHAAKDAKGRLLVGAAVGVKDETIARTEALLAAGADIIVLDIAHGHNVRAVSMVEMLRKKFGSKIEIIAGNIATKEAARDLIRAGADALKVGIGPGAACTTRMVTGVGVPQLTAIMDVVAVARKKNIPVIADGGVKNSDDLAKALAAGADTVMIGSVFAGTNESPGEIIMDRNELYKPYRGMASYDASTDKEKIDGTKDDFRRAPEGASGRVRYKGPVSVVIQGLLAGLRSSMTYVGAHNMEQFHKNARFIKGTMASREEARPYGVE